MCHIVLVSITKFVLVSLPVHWYPLPYTSESGWYPLPYTSEGGHRQITTSCQGPENKFHNIPNKTIGFSSKARLNIVIMTHATHAILHST